MSFRASTMSFPRKPDRSTTSSTDSATYGAWSQHFNGIDVTANVRFGNGFTFAGGTSTGQTVADNCDVRAHLPELATTTTGTSAFGAGLTGSAVTPVSPYCHVAYGMLTQFRGLSSYLVPKVDVQVAATFQSKPGRDCWRPTTRRRTPTSRRRSEGISRATRPMSP